MKRQEREPAYRAQTAEASPSSTKGFSSELHVRSLSVAYSFVGRQRYGIQTSVNDKRNAELPPRGRPLSCRWQPLQEHLRDVNNYCIILAMGTTFIARGPRANGQLVRGLVSVSLWIACAALAPLGAWAAPAQVTAPEPAPTPADVSDVNATSPRADLNDGATLESFFDGVFDVGMKEHHVAGAAVAVVKDGQLVFTKGYGYQDIDRAIPVDPYKTLFRIGSTTKLFTWTSVMQLVEQGKLDLDKDVNTYLKDVQIPATYDKPITLRHIMTHTSGFEEGFLGYLITNDPETQIPIKEAMQRHMPARVRPPGVMPSYSNYATALAGLIVEQVSGEPYNDYIARHVFEPLVDHPCAHIGR